MHNLQLYSVIKLAFLIVCVGHILACVLPNCSQSRAVLTIRFPRLRFPGSGSGLRAGDFSPLQDFQDIPSRYPLPYAQLISIVLGMCWDWNAIELHKQRAHGDPRSVSRPMSADSVDAGDGGRKTRTQFFPSVAHED
jgi:hypothetical protein